MDFAGMKRWDLQALCKQHGLPAGGTNAALIARLAACSALQGAAADAGEEVEVVARKGCLKRPAGGNGLGEAKKVVSFALEQSRGRRRRSQVTGSPAVVAVETPPASSTDAEVGGRGRGRRRRAEAVGASADEDSVAAEAGAAAPVTVRRSRRNSVALGDVAEAGAAASVPVRRSRRNSVALGDVAEAGAAAPVPVRRSRRNSVALGNVEAVQEQAIAVDRKRKWKSLEKEEETAVRDEVEVPRRVTRRSSLSGAALLSPFVVEKKRGRRKATDGQNELDADDQVAEAQDFAEAEAEPPATVESKRSGRKAESCKPVVQKSAKVEAPRITRSRAVAANVTEPIVVEKKRRTTEYKQPEVEPSTDLEVPTNDAPVTRALRNRVVQVKNRVVEKTNVSQELENKMLPSKPATRRNQQLASSMEEEGQEQVVASSKCPPSRQSGRNNSEASIQDSETNNSSCVLMEAGNAKGIGVEKRPAAKEPVRRLTRRSVVLAMLEKKDKDLATEKDPEPEAHVARAKRKSVVLVENIEDVSEEFQNAKGDVVVKKPVVKEPARRSTRKSVVSFMLEEKDNYLIVEKSPEAHVRRSKRKSVVLVEDCKGNEKGTQNAKGDAVVKQPVVKEPARRSTWKSIVSSMLEEEDKSLIAEKSPGAHVRRSNRKSVVLVEDCKGNEEGTQNAKADDVVKQPVVKEPARRSTHQSIVSSMLEEEENNLIAEKNSGAHVRRSKRKSVVLVKDCKGNGEGAQNAKGDDLMKQLPVKKPVRRSIPKSLASGVLEKDDSDLTAAKKSEAHDKRSVRKSVLPHDMINMENQDHIKMVRNEGKGGDEEKQLKAKGPVRLSRRSVATTVSERE